MPLSEKKQVMYILAAEALATREIHSRSLHYALRAPVGMTIHLQ
jgi:hypothetical protein